jgi:dTDP-4-dehydrorhamnose reductase
MGELIVVGSNGLLGRPLSNYLVLEGHVVSTCSRNDADYCVDLVSALDTEKILNKIAPSLIINLAALTNVDECEKDPQKAYLQNVKIVDNLVNWMKKQRKSCHLIHISTDQVYDGEGPHLEKNIQLRNYYGFSKYASELVAASVSSTILRTNFFGKSNVNGRKSISDWIEDSLRSGESITVFEDVFFSPLSINSLTSLIGVVVDKRHAGIYNLGSLEGMSKADFAFELAEKLYLPTQSMLRGKTSDVLLGARRPKDMRMDCSLFQKVFEIKLPTLREEIASYTERKK